jgi:chemotaxis protein methyltransferase CheR
MSTIVKEDHHGLADLTDRDFGGYQRLIYAESGIFLGPAKKALLAGRLARRMRELEGISFRDYLRLAETNAAERQRLVEAVCTHETHFFRVPQQFELLEREILPRWKQQGAAGSRGRNIVRAWSAGCSTGEEPFTLAMVLHHALPGWQIEIVATDFSTRVLEQARQANWPVSRASEIPLHYLKTYMLRGVGSQEGRMKAGPELRTLVRFERVNLYDDNVPISSSFDLIFCRNVLIYFDAQSRERALDKLFRHLAPQGYLFLGHAESLSHIRERVRTVIPAVFTPTS